MFEVNPDLLKIWQISDGKRGHENQSGGLIKGLSKIYETTVKKIELGTTSRNFYFHLSRKKYRREVDFPHIVIGAGRRTHWPILFCQALLGCRSICLMRPHLPTDWFDLCVVPRHDCPKAKDNIFITEGPLNLIESSREKNSKEGLILVGGESPHYKWDNQYVISQIIEAINSAKDVTWTITDSRRTPRTFTKDLINSPLRITNYVPFDSCEPSWLNNKLKSSRYVWTTPDSMAMIYESLSSGSLVGVLPLTKKKNNRVTRNLDYLVALGWVRTPRSGAWRPVKILDERSRTAKHIKSRWGNMHLGGK